MSLVGIQVTGPQVEMDGSTRPAFGITGQGTALGFLITRSSQTILGFEDAQTRILEAKDDTGRDLAKPLRPDNVLELEFPLGPMPPEISDDGHVALFQVRLSGTPAPGSTHIRLKADVAMVVGADPTKASGAMQVQPNAHLVVGPYRLHVEHAESSERETGMTDVELSTPEPLDRITALSAFSGGKELDLQNLGTGSATEDGQTLYTLRFRMPTVQETELHIDYYGKRDVQLLHVDASVSIGSVMQ